jgi:uncharacterized membrane protein
MSDLTSALMSRGILSHEAPPLPTGPGARPWFIGFVLGASGWIAGLCAMIVIGLLFRPDSTGEFALAAVILLGCAYGLYAVDRESAFFDQLALALSVAGQVALAFAVAQAVDSKALTCAIVAILQVGLVIAMPNRLARVLSTLFACIAWTLAWRFGWWDASLLSGSEHALRLVPALLAWVLVWGPLMVLTHLLIAREVEWMASGARRILRPLLTGLLIALTFGTFASEPFDAFDPWPTDTRPYTNWLVMWPLLAVGASMFAGYCALRLRNPALVGVAIAGALLHVMQFYFLLGTTLLVKSGIMVALGIFFFLSGHALLRTKGAS